MLIFLPYILTEVKGILKLKLNRLNVIDVITNNIRVQ